MLVPNQKIKVSWHNVTRKHYENKGYVFTKYRDYFYVNAEDLSLGCHAKVKVICDYCNNEFTKEYCNYLHEHDNGKDCCAKCQPKKNTEICMEKYGVTNGGATEQSKIKAKQSFVQKYGVDNPMKVEAIKNKLKEGCLNKYGVPYYIYTNDFKTKAKNTFIDKYGVDNPFASNIVQDKMKQTCMEHYGVEYSGASPVVRAKMMESMCKNGTIPISNAEQQLCNILIILFGEENCYPSYPYDYLTLDCLLSYQGHLIDIEYDGWYWHKNKQDYDTRRNYFLIRRGIDVIRFRANNAIPTEEDIQEAVDYIVKGNHSLYIKELDI